MVDVGKTQVWNFWRGSPDLLAQVVRTAIREAEAQGGTAECAIDVEVDGDHEVFGSPADFTRAVTREALRRFTKIATHVTLGSFSARIDLIWKRPWWKPGKGKDAEVRLEVTGSDEASVDAALQTIAASICRGKTNGEGWQLGIGLSIAYATAAVTTAAVVSGLYLLKVPPDTIVLVATPVAVLGIVAGSVWGTWLYPSLEVAPHGQTNLARMIRFGGPLMVGFILTGLAKALYG